MLLTIRIFLNTKIDVIYFGRQTQKKDQFTCELVFFQRCVPLARNVMCTSCVMFASQVMCASRVRMRNTSHHLATIGSNTSLWRSYNITAACRNSTITTCKFAVIFRKRLAISTILCYTNDRKAVEYVYVFEQSFIR